MIEALYAGTREIRGEPDGQGLRIRIVASRYNQSVVSGLIDAARQELLAHRVRAENILLVTVPGALEIPLALETGHHAFDAQLALGCVVRGETSHFRLVVDQCSAGVRSAAQRLGLPIGFGVLAVDNLQQAVLRSGTSINRGREAALAALEMANLLRRLKEK